MTGLLRFFFLPELGRSFRELHGSALRVKALCRVAFSPATKEQRRWRRAIEPGGRMRAAAGAGVMAAGSGFAGVGIGGLMSAEAVAQSGDPSVDFAELDPFEETSVTTRRILGFLNSFRPGGSGEGPAALADMLYVFNGGVLVLAGFLLVYHTVAGTVATARQGRWGFGGWEVMRLVIAVGLMVPLPPGGMNGGQHIVLGLARVGGDFANTVWQPFSDDMLGESETAVPLPKDDLWRSAMARALVVESCRAVGNAVVSPSQRGHVTNQVPFITRIRRTGDGSIAYGYDGWDVPNLCGAIRFRDVGLAQLHEEDEAVEAGDGTASRMIAGNAHYQAFAVERLVGGRTVLEELARIAEQLQPHLRGQLVVDDGGGGEGEDEARAYPELPDVDALLEPVGQAYIAFLGERLGEAARVETEDRRTRLDDMERDVEWLAAASFINTIAYRTGSFHSVAYGVPDVVRPAYGELEEEHDLVSRSVGLLVAHMERGGRYRVGYLEVGGQGFAGSLPGLTGSTEGLGGVLFGLLDLDSVFVASEEFDQTLNPIGQLASFGSSLISAALGTYTALIAATAARHLGAAAFSWNPFSEGVAEKVAAAAGSAWEVGGGFINMVLGILLIAGVVLTFVLPLIPFIRFLFGILSWLMSVVEAFLAITVFAAAHVTRGEGNQLMTSVTRGGWLFLPDWCYGRC